MKENIYKLFSLAFIFFLSAPARTSAQSPVPNFDFETWTTNAEATPLGWLNNNSYPPLATSIGVSQIAGVVGDAVSLHTAGGFPVEAAIYNTTGYIYAGTGGVPYSGSGIPANLNGYYRYHIVPGDSARMVVVLKRGGVMLSLDSFIITGDQPAFTSFSLPLTTVSAIPDSIIFMAESGTFHPAGAAPGSFLDLDELHFSNGSDNYSLLNGDFDTWQTDTVLVPDDWSETGNVTRSTDRVSGDYAAKLVTADNGSGLEAGILYGSTVLLTDAPYVDTLTGYYKYSSPGADKGIIEITFWYHVVTGGSATIGFLFYPATTYTYFKVPLSNTIHASDFNFFIASTYTAFVPGSTLLIDDMKIKSGNPASVSVPAMNKEQGKLSFYPLPCKDVVHIAATGMGNINNAPFVLYNMLGQEVQRGTISDNRIYLKDLPSGTYLCTIHTDDQVSYGRLEVLN